MRTAQTFSLRPNTLGLWLLRNRGLLTGLLLLLGLLAFEIFNFSTTNVALADLLGDQRFAGISWAAILAVAFCGIDFAGIARLFIPESEQPEQREVWFLFGAWLLAATMNALLTWWGVSLAIHGHTTMSAAIVKPTTITVAAPIFVALLVWVTRILLIGSFATSGARLFSAAAIEQSTAREHALPQMMPQWQRPTSQPVVPSRPQNAYPRPASASQSRPAPTPAQRPVSVSAQRPAVAQYTMERPEPEYVPEPTYTTGRAAYTSLSAQSAQRTSTVRRL
jgi:hypothetical protein